MLMLQNSLDWHPNTPGSWLHRPAVSHFLSTLHRTASWGRDRQSTGANRADFDSVCQQSFVLLPWSLAMICTWHWLCSWAGSYIWTLGMYGQVTATHFINTETKRMYCTDLFESQKQKWTVISEISAKTTAPVKCGNFSRASPSLKIPTQE